MQTLENILRELDNTKPFLNEVVINEDGIDEGEAIRINGECFYDVNTGDLTSLLTNTKEKLEDFLDKDDLYFTEENELIVVNDGEEYVVDDITSAFEALSDILYMDDVEIGSYE